MIPKAALPDEKQKELFEEYAVGHDPEIRSELIERNIRLVIHCAKKFSPADEIEDLVSIGTIGLIKAVDSFDPNKDVKFATYATRCIDNEILMHLRKQKKIKQETSIYEKVFEDANGNGAIRLDVLEDDEVNIESDYVKKETIIELMKIISNLSKREQFIILQYLGFNEDKTPLTQKEIASILDISQSYISRVITRIINKIRKEMDLIDRNRLVHINEEQSKTKRLLLQ